MRGVLGDVEDPDSGGSLLDAWSGELQTLGSGSDYAGERISKRQEFVWGLRGGGGRSVRGRDGDVCWILRGDY